MDNFENQAPESSEMKAPDMNPNAGESQNEGANTNTNYQQQYQDNYHYNVGNGQSYGAGYTPGSSDAGMDMSPMSVGEWVITYLLTMMIPCVNIIMLLVWSFSKTGNINRRNFCRAALIFMAIGYVFSIIVVIVAVVAGLSAGGAYYY